MAEPIPSASNEAGDDSTPLPANAEDRKAAKALNALDANAIDSETTQPAPKQIDQDALGKAMNRLEIAAGSSKKEDSATPKKVSKFEEKMQLEEEEAKRKRAVKVKAEDVSFLCEELELSKAKSTDLLKTHGGDPAKAIRAFIAPPSLKA